MLKFISLRPAGQPGQFRAQPEHCPGWPMPGYGPGFSVPSLPILPYSTIFH